MVDAEETRRRKAQQLRYKKPVVSNLNLDYITQDLWDIQEACEEVHWYTDSDDGTDSLINALDGNEDEAYEFRMAFADLCAECERMMNDLQEEWIPECFDLFFVAAGGGAFYEIWGYDTYEQDYFGIGCSTSWAEDEAKKKLKQLTKDQLIAASRQCFKIFHAYMGLRSRFDNLKAAIDILKDQNTAYLQAVKEIERLYEEASDKWNRDSEWNKASIKWRMYTDALPPEAWIV